MPDEYSSIFSEDPRAGLLTYPQLVARRQIAAALATRNRPYPKTIGEGLTALGEGLGEGYNMARLDRAEAAQAQRDTAATRSLTPGATAPGGASLEGDPNAAVADATETKQPLTTAQASQQPQMPIEEWMQRVARNESGGRKDAYTLVGERSRRGDYPYGKYQVMGENVPAWTQAYLGKKMTPQEFLADPDAQEQVARARGGEYLTKYGPVGAAAAWFAGEKGMNDPNRKDTLGTHVAEYKRRFNIPLVSRDQVVTSATRAPVDPETAAPVQVASLGGGMPTPDTAPDPREAVTQTLAGQPPQQRVAQAAPLPVAQQPTQNMPVTPLRPVDPGPEPQLKSFVEGNPQLKQQMDNARRIALDPRVSPHIQAQAQAVYSELEKRANDAYAKQWTIWHERTKVKEAWELAAETRQQAREAHAQKTIQPSSTQQQPAQPHPDLGTDRSPQRTGIPNLPPVPSGTSPEKWSELQAPVASTAVEAVQKATPMFDDAIKTIQTARNHPGKEYGLGATGVIARQVPQTDAFAFGKVNDQMVGKTFLTAYNTLKGGGQISNVEGEKAQTAQARLDPRLSPKEYDAALNDLEKQLRRDQEIAQRKINMPVTAWRQPGDNSSYAPDIGQRRGDHEYVGGNPSDPASWKKFR